MLQPPQETIVADRTAQAKKVVEKFLADRHDGGMGSEEQLLAAHPDLTPELQREMRKVRLIADAKKWAQSSVSSGTPLPKIGFGLTPDSREPRLPKDSFPGYDLKREVHRGGQGVVYEATQKSTGRHVAIKVMKEGPFASSHDKARFDREIHILAVLEHPNIVTIHDRGSAAGNFYYVMDYIEGEQPDVYTRTHNSQLPDILRMFSKICKVISAAHLRGIIHRDLKPSNIRIDSQGEPHILDFGLAKIAAGDLADEAHPKDMTITGQFIGSLPWASPEQADGSPGKIDMRTDVYSLGVILHQILTGRFPYEIVGTMREVMDNIIHAQPPRPSSIRPDIDDEIDTIILKALAKEPERRYQTAGEFGRDLDRYLAGEPIIAKGDSTWYVIRKTLQRYRTRVVVAVAFVVMVFVFGVVMSVLYHRAVTAEQIAEQRRIVAHREADNSKQVLSCLEGMFKEFDPYERGNSPVTVREVLDRGADRVAQQLRDQPEAQTQLMETIAGVYHGMGLSRSAVKWRERVLLADQSLYGEGHLEVARSKHNLAAALTASKDFERAEKLLREALETRRGHLGDEHADVATTILALAVTLHRGGEYEEPEKLYRQSLALIKNVLTEPHADIVTTLRSFAIFLENKGDYAEAESLFRESLEMVRRLYEGDHPLLAGVIGDMAMHFHDTARYGEAEPYRREHVAMIRRLFPEDHPAVAASLEQLGLLFKDMERYEEAEPLILNALKRKASIGGEENRGVAYSYHCLAKLYTDAGNLEKAETACRRALELHRIVWPKDHRNIARPMTHLGRILVRQGRYEEAEPLLRKALEIRMSTKPPGHWKTAKTRSVLGACLAGVGRFEDAEPLLLESYPIISKDRGPGHRRTREAIQRVVDLYVAWDKPDEVATYRAMQTPAD